MLEWCVKIKSTVDRLISHIESLRGKQREKKEIVSNRIQVFESAVSLVKSQTCC